MDSMANGMLQSFFFFLIFIIRHGKIKHNDCFNYIYNILRFDDTTFNSPTTPSTLWSHGDDVMIYEYFFFLKQDVVMGWHMGGGGIRVHCFNHYKRLFFFK